MILVLRPALPLDVDDVVDLTDPVMSVEDNYDHEPRDLPASGDRRLDVFRRGGTLVLTIWSRLPGESTTLGIPLSAAAAIRDYLNAELPA